MKHTLTLLAALLLAPLAAICGAAESPQPVAKQSPKPPAKTDATDVGKDQAKRYNVLFIAVDDLNDWVGCLGGKPGAWSLGFFVCDSIIAPQGSPAGFAAGPRGREDER